MKPAKNAIAFVIYGKGGKTFLAVKRPANDENLPNLWGLPAGRVEKNESFEDCVLRAGKEKLGVELKIVKKIGSGNLERKDYLLHLEDFEAEIVKGKPEVPQPAKDITQYVDWKWAVPEDLLEAAKKGSLCSRIFLDSLKIKWKI